MKKIRKKEIERQVKERYKEAREWCSLDHRHYYKLMINTDTGEIWVDLFTSTESWSTYNNDAIVKLDAWGTPVNISTTAEIEDSYIKDAVYTLREAGWEVEGQESI